MDVVFLGVNNFGWDIYEWLCERDTVEVRALITESDQLDLLEYIEPELVVASGFGEILSPETLSIPERGCINVHPGYLPNTRGYNPNVWSIVEDQPAGVSIHYMTEEIDQGDILGRREVDKTFEDTGKSLYDRIERAAVDLFKETWPAIEDGTVDPISQDEEAANSHLKQDFVDLCEIDPRETYEAKELLDILRALTFPPFDNAYLEVDGEKYYVDVEIREASNENSEDGFISGYE
jgi:methionyl-tRNA formyltransferase